MPPFAVSLATSSNWWQPLSVLGMFAAFETVAAMVIEPMLFSQSAGTSKLAILIAIAFWIWLGGPVGLLLATPLTACLAVIAKYVPQLEFIAVLFDDQPMMQVPVTYYQRLLAQDQDEAETIVEEQLRTHAVEHVFDEVLVPALHYAKRDSQLPILSTPFTGGERNYLSCPCILLYLLRAIFIMKLPRDKASSQIEESWRLFTFSIMTTYKIDPNAVQ